MPHGAHAPEESLPRSMPASTRSIPASVNKGARAQETCVQAAGRQGSATASSFNSARDSAIRASIKR